MVKKWGKKVIHVSEENQKIWNEMAAIAKKEKRGTGFVIFDKLRELKKLKMVEP